MTNPAPGRVPLSDPRYPIWGRLFMCRVPRISHYSTQYLETYGLPTSGNRDLDRDLIMQSDSVYITINDMIEHYNQNTTISIVKQHDTKEVYEICQEYTFDWADRLQQGILAQSTPFEDLIKIDEFAAAVYEHAGHMYGVKFARTFIPEGVLKNAIDLQKMFDSIDKRVKTKHKEKEDHYTVRNKYSPPAKNTESDHREKPKIELPARPSARELIMAYMDKSGFAGRL